MKSFQIPMLSMSLLGLCLLSGLDAPPAQADFIFGAPTNLGPVINSPAQENSPSISANGLSLFFLSERSGGYGARDIWVARRATTSEPWTTVENLGPPVNTSYLDANPSISIDGLTLFFNSDRPGGIGGSDLWVTTRATESAPWGTPVNLGPVVNSTYAENGPDISADGLTLYFNSDRPGGYGAADLWVATRATVGDPWNLPLNVGPIVNGPYADIYPRISPDGLALFLTSTRPGGYGPGYYDLFLARRAATQDPWGPPMNLRLTNSAAYSGRVSADGSTLYFGSLESGAGDLYQAPLIRVVDFNGDGKVDATDMGLLVDNWGRNQSRCDIGPFPWGDGVVDEKDLRVLMESLTTPGPQASDVPSDVVLSWVSPSFANTCDVYFGTSFEAVNSADRTKPQGVLVSQGQTATAYDPAGLLEFSQTYYWRVDFVISGPAPIVYQGPVLSFTSQAFARPIRNITATASSAQRFMGPEKTVNGSGLDQNDGHSTNANDMWLSQGKPPQWIQYQFDQVYTLHELWVWNSNQLVEPFIGFGAKSAKIEYSTDGTTWTPLAGVPEFARAPGQPGYVHNTTVSFGGVPAKFVKLTVDKTWGGVAPQTGLSEVRFFYIPDRSAAKP